MPAHSPFEYAIVRLVPHVEREEFLNVGVIVFSEARDFLGARIELELERLGAFCPDLDVPLVREHLAAIPRICAGGLDAGPIGKMPLRERWRWLVAPRSTMLQTSAPHAGLCTEPAAILDQLIERVVLLPRPRI